MISVFNNYISYNYLWLCFLALAIVCHILAIKIINFRKQKSISLMLLNQHFLSFQKHLDQYYVKNVQYTIFMNIVYVIATFGIFFFTRLLLLSHETEILTMESSINVLPKLFLLLLTCLSFIIFIVFYKSLIDIIFFRECIKFHLYFSINKYYNNLQDYITLSKLTKILANIQDVSDYLLLTDQQLNDISLQQYYANIPLFLRYKKCFTFIRNIGQKNKVLWFILDKYNTFIIYYGNHLYRLYILPQTIVILIGCGELFNGKLHYFYYGLPLVFLINILGQYYMFFKKKQPIYDNMISEYFYSINYKKLRSYFMHNDDVYNPLDNNNSVESLKHSYNTGDLERYFNRHFEDVTRDPNMSDSKTRIKIHKQQIVIVLLFIVYYYAIIWTALLYIPLIIMYYFSTKISYYKDDAFIVDNRKYAVLFWIILLVEIWLIYTNIKS